MVEDNVISVKKYTSIGEDELRDITNVNKEQQWPQYNPCGTPDKLVVGSEDTSIYTDTLGSFIEIVGNPLQ